MRGLSLVVASGGHFSSRCAGLSLSRPLLLQSTSSRRAGSAVVAQGPSCSAACGIFPDQGSNPCPLHWQADSQPLRHQGSPPSSFLKEKFKYIQETRILNPMQLSPSSNNDQCMAILVSFPSLHTLFSILSLDYSEGNTDIIISNICMYFGLYL